MTDNEFEEFEAELDALKYERDIKGIVNFLNEKVEENKDDAAVLSEAAEVYYSHEVGEYERAVRCAEMAYTLFSDNPLIMYRYACALFYVDRYSRAIDLFSFLLHTPVAVLAYGPYGEGQNYAKSLHNDARFMLGLTFLNMGAMPQAADYLKAHLQNRKRGMYSDFHRQQAVQLLKEIEEREKNP